MHLLPTRSTLFLLGCCSRWYDVHGQDYVELVFLLQHARGAGGFYSRSVYLPMLPSAPNMPSFPPQAPGTIISYSGKVS